MLDYKHISLGDYKRLQERINTLRELLWFAIGLLVCTFGVLGFSVLMNYLKSLGYVHQLVHTAQILQKGCVVKTKVLIDAKVIADVSKGIRFYRDMASYAKQAESLVSDLNEFVRDHRSMDFISLYVEREYEDRCSHCESTWELDSDGIPVCCNKAIEEHLSSPQPNMTDQTNE